MPTVREMSEAHLTNVSNQITILREQKQKLDAEIANLVNYLEEGSSELTKVRGTEELSTSFKADVVSAPSQQTF